MCARVNVRPCLPLFLSKRQRSRTSPPVEDPVEVLVVLERVTVGVWMFVGLTAVNLILMTSICSLVLYRKGRLYKPPIHCILVLLAYALEVTEACLVVLMAEPAIRAFWTLLLVFVSCSLTTELLSVVDSFFAAVVMTATVQGGFAVAVLRLLVVDLPTINQVLVFALLAINETGICAVIHFMYKRAKHDSDERDHHYLFLVEQNRSVSIDWFGTIMNEAPLSCRVVLALLDEVVLSVIHPAVFSLYYKDSFVKSRTATTFFAVAPLLGEMARKLLWTKPFSYYKAFEPPARVVLFTTFWAAIGGFIYTLVTTVQDVGYPVFETCACMFQIAIGLFVVCKGMCAACGRMPDLVRSANLLGLPT